MPIRLTPGEYFRRQCFVTCDPDDVTLPLAVAGLGGEWDGSEVLFGFQSFTAPVSIYRFDLKTKETSLWGQVKADIAFDNFIVEQVLEVALS